MTWICQQSFYISCSDIYGLCLTGEACTLFWFWQSRRSNSENWLGFGCAVKLRGALCKMNPILRSLRLSMGGVDPLIDDHTPLFFFCSGKHRSQPSVWGLWSCCRSLIDAKAVFKKKQPAYLCCCPQSGAHRMQTQCSEGTTDLGPAGRTIIQGRAPLILIAWTACAARAYLGTEDVSAELCQTDCKISMNCFV